MATTRRADMFTTDGKPSDDDPRENGPRLGDERVLVGHSMGGKVAQLAAATHPEGLARLVLVGPGPAKPADVITPEYQAALSRAQETLTTVLGYVGAVMIESACRHIPVDRSAIGSDGMVADPLFRTGIAEVWTGLVHDAGQGAGAG